MASNYTINMQPGVIYNDIHDNENVYLTVADGKVTIGKGNEQMIRSSNDQMIGSSNKQPKGRPQQALFKDGKGQKDKALTRRMAGGFVEYLRQYGAENDIVDCRKDNPVCKAFAAFYCVWAEEGLVERRLNGGAACRFLKEDCRLTVEPSDSALGRFMRQMTDSVGQNLIADVRKIVHENTA